MKKLAILTAIATLLGSMSITMPASAEQQMDLGGGWKVIDEGETVFDSDTFAMITDKKAHSGKYSLYVKGTSDADRFRVEHAAEYTSRWDNSWDTSIWEVSFWVNSDNPNWREEHAAMYNVQVGIFNNNGGTRRKLGWSSEISDWSEPDADGWRKATFTFKYPFGAFAEGVPQAHVQVIGATLGVYIDDFQIRYVGSKESLQGQDIHLLNGGDFELLTETGEDIASHGWTKDVNASLTTEPNIDIVADPTGNKMMRIQFPQTTTGWTKGLQLHKALSLPKTSIAWSDFVLSFKMKGQYFRGNVEVGNQDYTHVAFLTGKPNSLYADEFATVTPLENGWTQYDVKVGGQIEDSTIDFVFYDWNGEIFIDDISVRKVNVDASDASVITATYSDAQIFNGSFDAETVENIAAKNWSTNVAAGQSGDLATRSTKFAYSGKNSMYIAAPNSYVDNRYVQVKQKLPADLDYTKAHTLKLKMKTLSPETNLYVYYGNNGNNKCSERTWFVSDLIGQSDGKAASSVVALGNGWYEYTTTIVADNDVVPETLTFEVMSGLDATWIDDVSLTDENGKEYIVNGSFEDFAKYEVDEPYMVDFDGMPIWAPAVGENYLYVPVKVNEAGLDFDVYFTIYKDGKLFKVAKTSYLDAAVGEKEIEAMVELDTVSDGVYTAKAFVWNGEMVPYTTGVTEFKVTEE